MLLVSCGDWHLRHIPPDQPIKYSCSSFQHGQRANLPTVMLGSSWWRNSATVMKFAVYIATPMQPSPTGDSTPGSGSDTVQQGGEQTSCSPLHTLKLTTLTAAQHHSANQLYLGHMTTMTGWRGNHLCWFSMVEKSPLLLRIVTHKQEVTRSVG